MAFASEKLLRSFDIFVYSDVFDFVNNEKWILYAYTTKKSYMKEFCELRDRKYFHLTVREMDKDEFEKFEKAAKGTRLDEYEFITATQETKLIATKHEYDDSKYGWINIISNRASEMFGYIPYYLIDAFNDEYREALHDVGLNALIVVADPELESAMDVAENNFDDTDYVVTISHNGDSDTYLGRKVMLPISLYAKSLNVFIHIFGKLFKA